MRRICGAQVGGGGATGERYLGARARISNLESRCAAMRHPEAASGTVLRSERAAARVTPEALTP